MEHDITTDCGPLLGALARMYASEGDALGVAILAFAKASVEQTDYDNWDGGTYSHTITLALPTGLYSQIHHTLEDTQKRLLGRLLPIWNAHAKRNDHLVRVVIAPALHLDPTWPEKARAWLAGEGVTNQGRVRSDNVAPREKDGLLFRSQAEIHLYSALKALDVAFAPLPVFLRGGPQYRRIEPDFVILHAGVVMVVEVDGDTVHTESPAEAHARTTMLQHEGAYVERVLASDCDSPDKAKRCAQRILDVLAKHKASRA